MTRHAKIATASLLALSTIAPAAALARDEVVVEFRCPIGTIPVGWFCVPITRK